MTEILSVFYIKLEGNRKKKALKRLSDFAFLLVIFKWPRGSERVDPFLRRSPFFSSFFPLSQSIWHGVQLTSVPLQQFCSCLSFSLIITLLLYTQASYTVVFYPCGTFTLTSSSFFLSFFLLLFYFLYLFFPLGCFFVGGWGVEGGGNYVLFLRQFCRRISPDFVNM